MSLSTCIRAKTLRILIKSPYASDPIHCSAIFLGNCRAKSQRFPIPIPLKNKVNPELLGNCFSRLARMRGVVRFCVREKKVDQAGFLALKLKNPTPTFLRA